MRPTSRAAAASDDVAGVRHRPARSAARRGPRRDRSASARASAPRLAMAAASSAPCIGDSVECQKPAAVRANSRWSSPGTSRCDGSTGSSNGIASSKPKLRPTRARSPAVRWRVASLAMIAFWDLPRPNASVSQRQSMRGQIDEVVGENRRDAAVVAGAGAAHDAVLDERGRGDHLEHGRGGCPGAQRQLRRSQARIGRRLPDQCEHAAVGDRDDHRAAERDLEGAQKVLRRLLQARIQRQLGAAAVGEIGDVAVTGETDRVGAERAARAGSAVRARRRFGAGGGQESASLRGARRARPDVRDIFTPSYM